MIDLSHSSIGFHKNVPVKMEQKRCSWQTTIQFLPGTDEEEKREKNKRYEEHRPERKLNTKWQEGRRGNVNNKTIRNIYCYENFCSHTILLLQCSWFHMTWIYEIRKQS